VSDEPQLILSELESEERNAWTPPDNSPCWKWCEENISLDATAPVQGRYSTALTPMIRSFYNHAQAQTTRFMVVMVSAQSAKTQGLMNFLAWCIRNSPGPSMWVMATQENAKEFVKKRLRVGLEHCSGIKSLMPRHRGKDSLNLIQFTGMNLLVRGSNSRAGLQSDPIRRVFCDERREWSKGAIDLLRKRTRTFFNSIEISVGTAGKANDELHVDWMKGSQTFFHWHCPHCQHSQPFRFGRDVTALFPTAREKGGLRWEKNEITKPGGEYDIAEVKKTVTYECESCGVRFKNQDKFQLLQTLHEHHRNLGALPTHVSLHWNALYMPWASCDWAEIVGEFLSARKQVNLGNLEPLKAFTTETLGEPWEELREDTEEDDVSKRRSHYLIGEPDQSSKSIKIITVDVQHGHLIYVCRQHTAGAKSRLLDCGRVLDFDDLRAVQMRLDVRNACVWIDSAHLPIEVGKACLLNGWRPLLGDDAKDFTRQEWSDEKKTMITVRSHWKAVEWDPGCGGDANGKRTIKRYSWANEHYKDRLYLHMITGAVGEWTIAKNTPDEYLKQVAKGYWRKKEISNGVTTYTWQDGSRRDYADCELMQLVVCDIGTLV
jgi:hypothetical protein